MRLGHLRAGHLTPVTAGLSAACALLLLAGCGSDDSDSASGSSSPAAASSSAGDSSDGSADAFCTEATAAGSDLNDLFASAGDDLSQLPALLSEAADRFSAIEAPDAISADWGTLTDGITQLADAAQGVDFTDQTQVATFEQSISTLEAPLTTAQTNVSTYLSDECGIDPDTGESAAPTS